MRYQINEYYPDDGDNERADAKRSELEAEMIAEGETVCPACGERDAFFIDYPALSCAVECDECGHKAILRDVLEAD